MLSINTAKALSTLVNPDKILPVAIIETAGTAGRTYRGYKRGGKVEGRERLREETSTAVFWLFGVKVLNKIGDFIGKKCGLDYLNVDVGKDALRAPFLNIPQNVRTKTCGFKFAKIFSSAVIATLLTGFLIPKLNHKITDMANEKETAVKNQSATSSNLLLAGGAQENGATKTVGIAGGSVNIERPASNKLQSGYFRIAPSFEEFYNNSKNQNRAQFATFKGNGRFTDFICKLSHNMENNTMGRLISTDAGMIAGRVVNSRNPVEGAEFAFRDTSSIYFYLFATPHVAALLNKVSGNTPIHPDTLNALCEHYKSCLGSGTLTPDEFMKSVKDVPDNIQSLLSIIPFDKNGVVTLEKFNEATDGGYSAKALLMSQMQPKRGGVSLLSRKQVEDIFTNGWNQEPEFLKKAVNAGTYGAALNPDKFVSRKVCEGIRNSVDVFAQNLVKYAKNKGVDVIDASFAENFAKKTTNTNLVFRAAGIFVSCFGLAYLIPKLQYKMTELRTGSKEFPGTADYSDCLNVKTPKDKTLARA